MTTHRMALFPRAQHRAPLLVTAALLALAGCGGGAIESVVPTVSSVSVAPAGAIAGAAGTGTYGQKLRITVSGNALDRGITARSFGCTGMTKLDAAPYASNATTAYYECTLRGVGTQSVFVTRDESGIVLGSASAEVPLPQVTVAIGNGSTSLGSFVITLEPGRVPRTVENFLAYVDAGFYVGTRWHRFSPGFVLQGGGYEAPLVPGQPVPALKATNAPIVLEDSAGLSNLKWTVAMARTGVPDSATSQWFINLVDNTFLDRNATTGARGYAVFGTISAGTEVVTAMTQQTCLSYPGLVSAGECTPVPNLLITAIAQTR